MALNGIHAKLNTDESIKEVHDMEMSRIMKCIHMLTKAHTHTQSSFKVQIMVRAKDVLRIRVKV